MRAAFERWFTRRTVCSALVMIVALGLSLTRLHAQELDPVLGTWKLNVAKSTFPGGRGPRSQTVKFEKAGRGTAVTSDVVGPDGRITRSSYTAFYDGKRHPILGVASADSVSFKRIDAWTVERTDTKAGRFMATVTRVLSKDGKVLTVTTKAFDAQGRAIVGVTVYDRQ
jgi:hypothetical protein